MKSSTKDKAEDKMHQMKGDEIKEPIKQIAWNGRLKAEGTSEGLDGKVQEKQAHIETVEDKQKGSFYT
jgi:uncharacterized protein YjbJ (UPF0337 family)